MNVRRAGGWLLLGIVLACSTTVRDTTAPDSPHPLHANDSNAVRAPVGRVVAVVESNDDTFVFSDTGLHVFAAATLVGANSTVSDWRSAAAITSPDHAGPWVVATDGTGELWRVRDRSRLERVRDRFSLGVQPVRGVTGAPGSPTVFTLDSSLAWVEGATLRQLAASNPVSVAVGGTIAATTEHDRVIKLSAGLGAATAFPLRGVIEVAVDAKGRIYAARSDGAYVQRRNELVLAYESKRARLHGLTAAGDHAWIADDAHLIRLEPETTPALEPALALTNGAKLFGTATGELWIFDHDHLARCSAEGAGNEPAQTIFQRACAHCHGTNPSSGIVLSTPSAWQSHHEEIHQRVWIDRSMPPAGQPPITDRERKILSGE